MKKIVAVFLLSVVAVALVCANGTQDGDSGPIEVTMLGTIKPEISSQFEDAVDAFNDSQDNYEVVIVLGDGSNPVEKMTTLYASGNAPTIMVMGQEFPQFQDKLLDVTDSTFAKAALPGTADLVTIDGRVFGMPVTVEAFGLLYNQTVLNKAVGGSFEVSSIDSMSSLKSLLDDIEALENIDAVHLSPMDWSLGAHVSNILFSVQAEDSAGRRAFMDALKKGSVSLEDNEVFKGWLDTFDLLMENNENAESPLSPDYDMGTIALGSGDVGIWFMGNWAYPQLREIGGSSDYGIIPYPVSDNPRDYGNTQISVGVPLYIVIDESQSTEAEQQGAVEFLNWLVNDPVGQDYYVNQFNFIPVFDTFDIQPSDSMSLQILEYVAAGKSLEWMNSLYPPDGWPTMGASMQKYLDGRISRAQLAFELEEYWKGVK